MKLRNTLHFVVTPVALDGIAVIVNPHNNPVNSLSIAQIRDIYNGKVTNWKDVGGKDMAIVVIGRDSASGTRTFFTDTVMNKTNYVKTQFEKNSNGAIQQSVAQTPGAIGYVGLGYIDPTVKALKINVNGTLVEPSVKTVLDKTYPISRSLLMITNGQPTGLVKDYIDYILSPEGQQTGHKRRLRAFTLNNFFPVQLQSRTDQARRKTGPTTRLCNENTACG